jgi:predicted GIY-YIG superfamily endonuclease
MSGNKNVVITGPAAPVSFSIYRITLGEYVYIGHTRDIYERAHRHATDTRRTIGRLFCELNCVMYVEHIDEAVSKDHAREVEQRHIELAKDQHGHLLLNVHHARAKNK